MIPAGLLGGISLCAIAAVIVAAGVGALGGTKRLRRGGSGGKRRNIRIIGFLRRLRIV